MKIEIPVESEMCQDCGKCIIVCPDRLLVFDIETKEVSLSDDIVLKDLEDRLSGALLNLIKEEIYRDGVVSEDEKALLSVITRHFSDFQGMMRVAEPILYSAKKFLFKKIWDEAIKDGVISQDEHAILAIVVDKLNVSPDEKEQFINEVEAEARAVKELRKKLMK